MSTQSFSTRIRHDDNATFQEWASEFYAKLVAIGLTQTADTGQLTAPVVAARPSTNTSAGYWIFAFNDAMQGTAPIYMRIEVGTNATANGPRILITVGTGTNGSGTITGTAISTAHAVHNTSTPQTTDTARQSLMCHTEGFFGFDWKIGAGASEGSFFFCRTVDSAGSPSALGAMCKWGDGAGGGSTSTLQCFRYAATAAAYTEQTATLNMALGFNPQTRTSSAVGADIQAFVGYTITPGVAPLIGVCGIIPGEISDTTTFSATLVGATAHTYIACTNTAGAFGPLPATTPGGLKTAMLWE